MTSDDFLQPEVPAEPEPRVDGIDEMDEIEELGRDDEAEPGICGEEHLGLTQPA